MSAGNAYIYLRVIQVISMLVCFHCLTVMKMLAEIALPKYGLGKKFIVLKITLVAINLQVLFFGILGGTNVFKCNEDFSSATVSSCK